MWLMLIDFRVTGWRTYDWGDKEASISATHLLKCVEGLPPLHKPLLAHYCRYRYGSVHALQFVSPSFQHQFTQMSHVKDAHLYSRNQNKNTTHRWKQTCFHTFIHFASMHNWSSEIRCSLIQKRTFEYKALLVGMPLTCLPVKLIWGR